MVPVVAGISFEIIQWAGRSDSKLADFFSKPGLAMQKLTTKEPTADMAEVAILHRRGLRKPGWMPGFSWNMSQEKAGRIILHTEKKVSQKVLLKDIWN